jgi:Trk-type K+ transport system membrane component
MVDYLHPQAIAHAERFTRFSLFQVVSAYTNTGMSLEDQSMVPFQKAYPMIFSQAFLILAGNTAFVSFRPDFLNEHEADWISLAYIVSINVLSDLAMTHLWLAALS